MDANEVAEVSVPMSEVDPEHLPNGDDSAFASDHHTAPARDTSDGEGVVVTAIPVTLSALGPSGEHVLVATSQGLLTSEQLSQGDSCDADEIKTTHIVIHDQSLTQGDGPNTPLPPPTPSTPLSRERGFRYQWDESVFSMILPVRCKSTNGDLYKSRFGSGGRGRCIRMRDHWYTPSEFEAVCGRASSKDWKRSIRYGGRTLQCLIEDGILQPHATSCTCSACCDDESVTGPVRLFQPYKRRKRDSGSESLPIKKKSISGPSKSPSQDSPNKAETLVYSISSGGLIQPLKVTNTDGTEAHNATIQIISADPATNFGEQTVAVVSAPSSIITTAKPVQSLMQQNTGRALSTSSPSKMLDAQEQKRWWQLEEMANSLVQQAQQLKELIEQTKQQSINSKVAALALQKQQMEKEKAEALAAVRIEGQLNLSRAIFEERSQKDIAVQQALAQARAEMQDKMDSVTVVSDDKQVFTVTFAAPPQTTQATMDSILDADGEDSTGEKE